MNKIYKTIISASAAAIVTGASMVPVNVLAWGDSSNGRATYTLEQINADKLGNTITFNSITNGKIGDERNFVGAKLANSTSDKWESDNITVKDGDVLTVLLYVHNNSPKGVNAIAEGVSASFSIPTTVGKTQTIVGYLNSSNATPNRYWDEIRLNSSENFYVEFVEGSAKYTNADANGKERSFSLSNDIIAAAGAVLGYDKMDGKIPGCYEYDGFVTMQVKIHTASTSLLSKTVRVKGTKTWEEAVAAKVGDEVEYQIAYKNMSAEQVDNVMIRDILPPNMEYVKGSTMLYNSHYQSGVKIVEDTVTTSGINIGSYASRGNAYVRFTAKVVAQDLNCGVNQLVNWASATVNSTVFKDDASVVVTRDDATCTKKDDSKKDDSKKEEIEDKPTRIVNTGATEAAGIALDAGSVVTALGYFIASRKKF